MNPDKFVGSTSGQFRKLLLEGKPVWTFIPNPLPPKIPLDRELFNALSTADRSLGELAGLGRNMPNPTLLISPFVRREAVLSSKIEGTQTDITDLYAYEAGQLKLSFKQHPPEMDVREVINYVKALEYGLERINTLPLSLRLIRELHLRLLDGVRGEHTMPGEFRTSQNWIGRPGCSIYEAEFVNDLEIYLHQEDDYPPLIRLALIHYQFEAIHPFRDGNGRIGRLLLSLLLVSWGLLPLPLLYLSAYFEHNREAYYDLLLRVSESSDWKSWFIFFLDGVSKQASDAIVRAKNLQDLLASWKNILLKQGRAAGSLLRIAEYLFQSPFISISQAQHVLGSTYHSARDNVEKLVNLGILSQVGESNYGKMYLAKDILRIIDST